MQLHYVGAADVRRAINEARHEVILSIPIASPVQDEVDLDAARGVSGNPEVDVRVYVPGDRSGRAGRLDRGLAKLAMDGAQVHDATWSNPRMAIIDRSVVVLARNEKDYSDGALVGRGLPFTPLLARSLTAPPAAAGRETAEGEGLPAVSREVLRQLALGSKDETAAREMGMALRTYRRSVAQLMERLDARSRFQAGFLAGRRGLL
ncbi:hypothetical protein [Streptomyces sp. NBC_00102]|uniref:hypothetical protein n=1 Tax=Streptomyces sp. NBC_00102 TaxID=2975652 RepID=UPI002259C34C|nr:hypothetical protein [Streptomyces sp. NBC_00102]MCX5400302.1 hypothetical protein [Streptomyces sp. NBC_00102]